VKHISCILAAVLLIFPVINNTIIENNQINDTADACRSNSPASLAAAEGTTSAAAEVPADAAALDSSTILDQISGSWVLLEGSSWKNCSVLTIDGWKEGQYGSTAELHAESPENSRKDALYLVSRTDDQGYFSFSLYEGAVAMHADDEIFGFTGHHQYQITEDRNGYAQDDREVDFRMTGRIYHDADGKAVSFVEIDGRKYQPVSDCLSADCADAQGMELLRRPETAFLPFLNLTISAAQAQLEGFGSASMTDYWKDPVTLSGLEGSVTVKMRSSGTVMFFFPKLPVWLDFEFDDYSVIAGIRLSGTQTTYSRNTKGDGYLFGTLELEDVGTISYGDPSGEDSIIIENGRTSSGNYTVEIAGRTYSVPVR